MSSDERIEQILSRLNEEDLAALEAMIKESPELLRDALQEYGYLKQSDTGFVTNEQETELPPAQRELLTHLTGSLDPPKTVAEIREMVGAEESAFRQQYSSAQYRSWLSDQLKSLSEAGELGRFRDGRTVHYTESPALAVRHWARMNEQFPQDLSVADATAIREDTGMPGDVISDAIRSITNDT